MYLGLSSGFTVNWHYCMGELASVEFGERTTSECSKCGMKDQKGCCETQATVIKVQDEHQLAKNICCPSIFIQENTLAWASPLTNSFVVTPSSEAASITPPDLYGRGRYLYVSVFRI